MRANTSQAQCDCEFNSIFKKMQGLRLVKATDAPLPLMDVTIYAQKYVALVSTSSSQTFITPKVASDYDATPDLQIAGLFNQNNVRVAIELHIASEKRLVLHPCFIRRNITYDVILGMDFLMKFGFTMRIGTHMINNFSPIFSTDNEIQYWRKITVVNGPQIQEQNAKIVDLKRTPPTSKKVQGLRRKYAQEPHEENGSSCNSDADEDVLDLHPSEEDFKL